MPKRANSSHARLQQQLVLEIDGKKPLPAFVVNYVKQLTTLERYVQWLQKPKRSAPARFFNGLFIGAQVFLLAGSLLGIPLLVKAVAAWRKQQYENIFQRSIQNKTPPDINEVILFPSDTRAYNHLREFAIEDDVIWHRKRSSKDAWKAMYFDGYPKKRLPKLIDVDGANLIVIDDKYYVHYKKLLKEYRAAEVHDLKSRHFNKKERRKIDSMAKSAYVAVDKTDLNNWKDKWFSLPVVHHVVNLFSGKELQIEPEARSIAISHRGHYNDYIEDAAGKKHPVSAGVTTLYVLASDGKSIPKFDPWSPKSAKVSMYFPETSKSVYTAIKIKPSASTIMAIGYETNLESGNKTLKIITKLGDIDTEGWNPSLKYSHSKNNQDKRVRILPIGAPSDGKDWKEHALPDGARMTSNFSIRQTGKGNNARLLKVEGVNKQGQWGYFYKPISADTWLFKPTKNKSNAHDLAQLLPATAIAEKDSEKTTVHDYQGKHKGVDAVTLTGFGERSYHSTLTFVKKGKKYDFVLNKKHGLATFLGVKSIAYEIVIPDEMQQDAVVRKLFSLKHVKNGSLKVDVKEGKDKLVISGPGIKCQLVTTHNMPAARRLAAP